MSRRFDMRTFGAMIAAATIGAAWASYCRSITPPPYDESELRNLIWVIFATPFALFLGWVAARRRELWLAAFVCFCIYFFAAFLAARYETCTVVHGGFSLTSCFTDTSAALDLAGASGHRIYFESAVVIHVIAAVIVAVQRALVPPPTARHTEDGDEQARDVATSQ